MTDEELMKRAEELAERCSKTGNLTYIGFLTPAQAAALRKRIAFSDCSFVFDGGFSDAERTVCFFLPDWMEKEDFHPEEYLCVLEVSAHFGEPSHRDYLGAVMNLGIAREWIGDILIDGSKAWIICFPSVFQHILLNLRQAGRCGLTVRESAVSELPMPERKMKEIIFSVKSLRLDAVCAGSFGLSRSRVTEFISQGLVSLNYVVCQKNDASVSSGDILSLRGKGKCVLLEAGGKESRKGRLFVKAGLYL